MENAVGASDLVSFCVNMLVSNALADMTKDMPATKGDICQIIVQVQQAHAAVAILWQSQWVQCIIRVIFLVCSGQAPTT
jgi:hypothetical protein